jgi:hypothetical protein
LLQSHSGLWIGWSLSQLFVKVGRYMHLVVKCQNHLPKWGFIKTISYGSSTRLWIKKEGTFGDTPLSFCQDFKDEPSKGNCGEKKK